MNEFDDPQLASMLGRMSGEFPDVNTAHQAVHVRVRQAKRRRAMVSSTAAVFVLLGGAAVVAQGVDPRGQVSPADSGSATSVESTDRTEVENTEVESTETSSTIEDETSTSVDTSVTVTVPSGTSGGSGSGSNAGSSSSSSSSSAPRATVAVVQDADTTLDSAGGSIVYHWDGTTLTLVSVTEADGWTPKVLDETATRIRVEFSSDKETWRIEVRTDGSGKQPIETTLHG